MISDMVRLNESYYHHDRYSQILLSNDDHTIIRKVTGSCATSTSLNLSLNFVMKFRISLSVPGTNIPSTI